MNVLVIGSGGREHALAWKLRQSPLVGKLYCAPGNPGIAEVADLVPIGVSDLARLADFACGASIGLTVVGPEQPLADGIVDLYRTRGLTIFGPTREAAALEWSKAFAKDFLHRHGIPTASSRTFTSDRIADARSYLESCPIPVVLKADGLAAGKGVLVCIDRAQAREGLRQMMEEKSFGEAGATVVVEEFLHGSEASIFAISDGQRFMTLAPAQDHKRVDDGDRGKNTGGMGAFAPTPFVTAEILHTVREKIIAPALDGMAREGKTYTGCLYVGLMLTDEGPKVVEFNCRFGDPETQVVLPLYEGDLAALLEEAARGQLTVRTEPKNGPVTAGHAVCVVLASGGYPDSYQVGIPIGGLESLKKRSGISVFHSGTRNEEGTLVTAGGRVLGITAHLRKGTLADAIRAAYEAVDDVSFEGMHLRRDIGMKAISGLTG